ncbi:MAG: phenylalanine--tRNA ligase beta subunit-related protein [Candidatus Dormibacteraeota bacterium]|nr:phenylalanine--tRNA ligase beta subunit-related protein [Candidatus Dormibacteraeota bacterium]
MKFQNQLDIELVTLELYELEVTGPREDFELEVARATQAARSGGVGDLAAARGLYRRFGIDPTRVRPSSEALLRRLKKGEPLPRVNSLVDIANAMSVLLQVPVGLYDLDKVRGDELVARVGAEGESYMGIGKEKVNVAGRICVADAEGPCGNPTSDSARTKITTETERAAWIYFLPVSDEAIDRTAELIAVFGRGLVRMSA